MALSIGIVGLPNVGKSTLFNALTKEQYAQVANYPFCTIEPNRAIVPVPDQRVEKLTELAKVSQSIHATVEFVDIAGLVRGASQGEGLGNKFLGQIRNTDAIVHVVRCFEDRNVVHVSGDIDPRQDIEIVNIELALADLQQLERRIEHLTSQVKGDKRFQAVLDVAHALQEHLQTGRPISRFEQQNDEAFQSLNREMRFLTSKPMILVANVDESNLVEDDDLVKAVYQIASEQGAEVVKICSKLEEELAGLSEEERLEYLHLSGAQEGGLEQIIHKSYQILGFISFFTMNEREVRAWTIRQGETAPKAAGAIHTDFERGFIRAEVIPYDTFLRHASWAAAKAGGEMRLEGKEYVVKDGDVIYFRFNV